MQITITNPEWLFVLLLVLAAILALLALAARPLIRYVITEVFNDSMSKLLTEKYTQNVAELLPSLKRYFGIPTRLGFTGVKYVCDPVKAPPEKLLRGMKN